MLAHHWLPNPGLHSQRARTTRVPPRQASVRSSQYSRATVQITSESASHSLSAASESYYGPCIVTPSCMAPISHRSRRPTTGDCHTGRVAHPFGPTPNRLPADDCPCTNPPSPSPPCSLLASKVISFCVNLSPEALVAHAARITSSSSAAQGMCDDVIYSRKGCVIGFYVQFI